MNQKNTTTNNFSLDSTDTELQQCMSDSVIETSCLELGDKYSPKGQITAHPFSLSLEELSGLINYGQEKNQNIQATQAFSSKDSSFPTEYSVGKISIQLAGDSKPGGQSGVETPKNTPLKNSSFPTDYSVGKNSIQLAEDSKPGGQSGVETPISIPIKDSSFPTDYSVGKISSQLAGDSKSGGQPGFETPISIPIKDYSFPTEYSVGKSPAKPVGGSGWLHKYTSLKETKTGLVEYPRVKEGQRSPNNPKHWYWDYCWHKKGKNGKPLYKKGKAVVSSVGCPIKKVRAASSAIAAKLPHRKILEIIKGDNSPPT